MSRKTRFDASTLFFFLIISKMFAEIFVLFVFFFFFFAYVGLFKYISSYIIAREDKGDREGIPHTHPIP